MSDTKIALYAVCTFTQEEFRLIGLALAGQIKPGSAEHRQALELNARLQRQRAGQLAELYQTYSGAAERAQQLLADYRRQLPQES